MAYVWSVAKAAQLASITGASTGDQLGFSVGTTADANCDGYADLVVGAPYDDTQGSTLGSAQAFASWVETYAVPLLAPGGKVKPPSALLFP